MEVSLIKEKMTAQEIFRAWSEIIGQMAALREATKSRLKELGYDKSSYKEDSNAEIESLLDMYATLDVICELS